MNEKKVESAMREWWRFHKKHFRMGWRGLTLKFECQESCSCKAKTKWCDECTCWPDIIIWGKRYKVSEDAA